MGGCLSVIQKWSGQSKRDYLNRRHTGSQCRFLQDLGNEKRRLSSGVTLKLVPNKAKCGPYVDSFNKKGWFLG